MRTVIIGAGPGGLTLAHGLRRAGHDVQVHERRPGPACRPAGYGIHLDADGLRDLHGCLPAANFARLDACAVPARDLIRFHDQHLRPLAVRDRETPENAEDPVTRRRAISRDALHEALLLGLNTGNRDAGDPIRWGKEFLRYDDTPDGRVRAHFADGTSTVADLLVGADGSNSRVRGQRLPGLDRVDLGVLNIAGRVPLTPDLAAALPGHLTDSSVNNIIPPTPGWMFVSTWRTEPGTGADRYVVWAWAADRTSYPADVGDLPPGQLRRHVSEHIDDWAPPLRTLVARTDPATIAAVPLRTMPTLPAWTPSNVTLLGDAVHNMTPMAGIGANTALRDAHHLLRALTDPGEQPLTARVGTYEERMRTYANKALALSTRNARTAATGSFLPRFAFRTALRAAEALPPLKRAMFGHRPHKPGG